MGCVLFREEEEGAGSCSKGGGERVGGRCAVDALATLPQILAQIQRRTGVGVLDRKVW